MRAILSGLCAPPVDRTNVPDSPARLVSRRPFVPDVLTGVLPQSPPQVPRGWRDVVGEAGLGGGACLGLQRVTRPPRIRR